MPRDLLNPVPSVAPVSNGAPGMSISASPAAFGAPQAQAAQGFGNALIHSSQLGFDQAAKEQGMLNETYATNAETRFLQKLNERMTKYKSQQGLQAVSDQEAAGADVVQIRDEIAKELPNDATKKAFDTLSRRYQANALGEIRSHATTQLKQADINSATASIANSIARSGQQEVATNPQEFGNTLGDIQFQTVRLMQTQGWGPVMQQGENGKISFADSDQGRQAQAVYEQHLGESIGKAWATRLELLATQNVGGAYQIFQDNKQRIPGATQAKLEQWFAPKILQEVAQREGDAWLGRGGKPGALPGVQAVTGGGMPAVPAPDQRQFQPTPVEQYNSPTGSVAYNLGNVKTPEGARNNTADFVKPQTPEDGVALAASNLQRNYRNMTIADIGKKWEGTPNYRTWVKNVTAATGWTEDTVPDLNDRGQMTRLLQGIAVAEKSPKDRMYFTPETIGRGIDAAMTGKPAITMEKAATLANIDAAYKDDPKLGKAVRQYVSEQYSILQSVALANEQAQRQEVEKAYDGYVTRIIEGKTEGLALQIARDPALSGEKRGAAYNMLQAHLNREVSGDPKTYGTQHMALLARVRAPVNDPQRITDPGQLFEVAGRDPSGLTVAGLKDLQTALKERYAPEGEPQNTQINNFLKSMKSQITGANEGLGIRDPKGDELYSQFYIKFSQAYEKGRKAGKSTEEMLDPDSPDYLGKLSKTFVRPMADWMADRMSRGGEAPAPAAAAPKVDLTKVASVAELQAAVKQDPSLRAEAERIAAEKGWMRKPAAAPAPPVR